MKQIIQVDDELKRKIILLENDCQAFCRKLEKKYQDEFNHLGKQIVVELIRIKNGKAATNVEITEENYESFIEIGLEYDGEYYPNIYIPIWKCKTEWFQRIGYLTRRNINQLEKIVSSAIEEMLEDREGE